MGVYGVSVISIHALREESDFVIPFKYADFDISIHALREESDIREVSPPAGGDISIHALREESDAIRKAINKL